jgi:predicted nucleic acid-binding protein
LFKHKERIAQASALSESELLECFYELQARVRFIEEGTIPIGTWMEARRLCREVDPKDAPFVALAAGARTIIARDADLTVLEKPFGIRIVTPRQWLATLSRAKRRMRG